MDENQPLVSKDAEENSQKAVISTQIKVFSFVLISFIGLLVSGSVQTQYVYSYIKKHDFQNSSTSTNASLNSSSDQHQCEGETYSKGDEQIQALTSDWSWYISSIEYGLALPIIFLVGPMVDKVGRKPVIMWNVMAMTISFAIKTLSVYFEQNLYVFLVGFAVEGLSGGFQLFHLANLAILADTSSTGKDRTMVMVIYDALIGLGYFITYVGTGYLVQLNGFTYPFAVSTGFFLVLTFIIGLTLKETLNINSTKETKLRLIDHRDLFFAVFQKKNINYSRGFIISYFLIFFLGQLPTMGRSGLLPIVILGYPFCWSAEHIGWYSAVALLLSTALGIAILKLMHTFWRTVQDNIIIILGLLSSIANFIILGFSSTDTMIYVATVFMTLESLTIPLIKAILSKVVNAKTQGALFANIYLIEAVNSLLAPAIFNNIYNKTVDSNSGITFFVMAVFPFVCIFLTILVTCYSEPNQVKHVTNPPCDHNRALKSDDGCVGQASIQNT